MYYDCDNKKMIDDMIKDEINEYYALCEIANEPKN